MPSRRAGAAGAQQLALSCQHCVRLEGPGGLPCPQCTDGNWPHCLAPRAKPLPGAGGAEWTKEGSLPCVWIRGAGMGCVPAFVPISQLFFQLSKNSPLSRGN